MKILSRLRKKQRGSVLVMTAAMLVVLVGLAALVVDLGFLYATRVQLTNMADAAALAGVQELPRNSDGAYSTAADYARLIATFAPVASYFTVNISSPNTPGLRDLQKAAALDDLLARVVEARNGAGRMAGVKPLLLTQV